MSDASKPTGEIVGHCESRPVYMSLDGSKPIVGDTKSFLDLRLKNLLGEERILRVEVSEETFAWLMKSPHGDEPQLRFKSDENGE